eukprot:TRINITY_DN142_c0_g1_i2.p1 TRINITY_DN142_c0_g1~~TRINITY_DN142_c0_g1_i2.p1  ORF type:complete len:566 (+),score=118.42 TRINITY_DN142_c0_g1_i2:194-1699(+)
MASPTLGWSGRSLSLLDPTYASKYIPIIASVSEHQPPMWTSYFMDIHVCTFLIPAGIICCFLPLTDASSFIALYVVTSVYFSGVMVRLMLVLAPAACIISGIALSEAFAVLTRSLKAAMEGLIAHPAVKASSAAETPTGDASSAAATATPAAPVADEKEESKETVSSSTPSNSKGTKGTKGRKKSQEKEKEEGAAASVVAPRRKKKESSGLLSVIKKRAKEATKGDSLLPGEMALFALLLLLMLLSFYVVHCVWAAAEAYSAPSIVLSSPSGDGGTHIFDDFREGYAWLAHNTDENDKVASWWDYGYQTTAMANRTVIVDNNTWNNTHIATVGMAMSSKEKDAWDIYRSLDVKYVFVIFGGLVGYPSDDINKFLWMVRIGGGVFPRIKEPDYLRDGNYRIDSHATPTMLNCLMYKLSYYRFAEAAGPQAFDRVRRTEIGKKKFKLTHFEEMFTTKHWMVRIYKLKEPKNRPQGKNKRTSKPMGKPPRQPRLDYSKQNFPAM